jgi:hypothetical protein
MTARPTLTVRRSDLPTWLCWPCGEVWLGNRRVALLVGGKPRVISIPVGEQIVRVRIDGPLPGSGEIAVVLTVEDGGSYHYRFGLKRGELMRASCRLFLLLAGLGLACWAGQATLPLLQSPALQFLENVYLASPYFNPRFFPVVYRLVQCIFSIPGGAGVGSITFLIVTLPLRRALNARQIYDLEAE